MIDAGGDRVKLILSVDAITPPLTGIGRYALALAQGLRGHQAIADVRYFSAYKWVADPQQALRANSGIAQVRRHVPAKVMALRAYFALRQLAFDHLVRRVARDFADYVLHSPNYLLFEHCGPCVTTVHDLSWLHYPQYHPKERVAIMHRRMPRSLERAAAVITDSEFVRQELIARYALPPERVHAIPLGVDASFAPRDAAATSETLAALGLVHGRYLLALATLEPRKNLARLVDAYERLPAGLRASYPLVLAGAKGWHVDKLVDRIDRLVVRGEALLLGFVPEDALPLVLAGARALAFPSIYEGFGLPPLEAMACGVPVVASDSSSIPEVVGDAALLTSPGDTLALTRALERALTDEDWREQAIARGLERARGFSWQRCVDATVDIYRSVAGARAIAGTGAA